MTKVDRGTVIFIAGFLAFAAPAWARPDIDAGRREFNMSCGSCHSLKAREEGKGPSLAGVFGRRAGSDPAFDYSERLRDSKVIKHDLWKREASK